MSEIQYRYALDDEQNLIDAYKLEKEEKNKSSKYICLGCEKHLIPKLGKKRKHHFCHQSEEHCSGETYLHLSAKNLFIKEYQWCVEHNEPFYIELYNENLCRKYEKRFSKVFRFPKNDGDNNRVINLIENYKISYLEVKDSEFQPDILLISDSGDRIYVEIVVTNKPSEKKLSSNNKIITIKIDNEADIEVIKTHELKESDSRIEFISFMRKAFDYMTCPVNCEMPCLLYMSSELLYNAIMENDIFNIEYEVDSKCVLFKEISDLSCVQKNIKTYNVLDYYQKENICFLKDEDGNKTHDIFIRHANENIMPIIINFNNKDLRDLKSSNDKNNLKRIWICLSDKKQLELIKGFINKRTVKETTDVVIFDNFKRLNTEQSCKGSCDEFKHFFVLYSNGSYDSKIRSTPKRIYQQSQRNNKQIDRITELKESESIK